MLWSQQVANKLVCLLSPNYQNDKSDQKYIFFTEATETASPSSLDYSSTEDEHFSAVESMSKLDLIAAILNQTKSAVGDGYDSDEYDISQDEEEKSNEW